jgi:acyl-coenzyme A thioesterase PaaI-like protein
VRRRQLPARHAPCAPRTEPALGIVTPSLKVDYVRPTPMGVPLEARGRIVDVKARKVSVEITASATGTVCARGHVVAVLMREELWPRR